MKYLALKKIIAERALNTLPDCRIAGFRELMQEFNVSQATVSRALDELENEGFIVRKWGVGILTAPARSTTVLKHPPRETAKPRKILFSYAAYYSGGLLDTLNTVEQCAAQRKFNVIFHKRFRDSSIEDLVDYIKSAPKFAGIILAEDSRLISQEQLELLGSIHDKTVLFMPYFRHKNLPANIMTVNGDEIAAGSILAEYFYNKGHRKIALVSHNPQSDNTYDFFKGFMQKMAEYDCPIPPQLIFRAGTLPWEDSLAAAAEIIRKKMDILRKERPTALIFSSADGAVAGSRPLRDAGFRVPEDISLGGHGDIPLFAHMPDSPATIRFDVPSLLNPALDYILSRKNSVPEHFLCPPQLKEYNGVISR